MSILLVISAKGVFSKYHQLLISPIEQDLKNKNHALILPLGLLQLMHFDLLYAYTSETDFRKIDYLIKAIPIS